MRKTLFRFGWVVLVVLPILYAIQGYMVQDLPRVAPWQWLILLAAVVMIFLSRNTDDVLKHHVV